MNRMIRQAAGWRTAGWPDAAAAAADCCVTIKAPLGGVDPACSPDLSHRRAGEEEARVCVCVCVRNQSGCKGG